MEEITLKYLEIYQMTSSLELCRKRCHTETPQESTIWMIFFSFPSQVMNILKHQSCVWILLQVSRLRNTHEYPCTDFLQGSGPILLTELMFDVVRPILFSILETTKSLLLKRLVSILPLLKIEENWATMERLPDFKYHTTAFPHTYAPGINFNQLKQSAKQMNGFHFIFLEHTVYEL